MVRRSRARMYAPGRAVFALALLSGTGVAATAAEGAPDPRPHARIGSFFAAASGDEDAAREGLADLERHWRDGYVGPILDLARFFAAPDHTPSAADFASESAARGPGGRFGPAGADDDAAAPSRPARRDPGSPVRARLIRFLEARTGERFGHDLDRWRRWLWRRPYDPHPDYARLKSDVYGTIDPRFRRFFPEGVRSTVRLDQIDWGGVVVNGIPPLDHPEVVTADQATWLKDKHVVFGIVVDGRARAYPKRILAWHELALDRLGDRELAVVYCTLCGTVIPYFAEVDGEPERFGTSGLLYRSNKLMFDETTGSLWSTLYGRPVLGALVGSDRELESAAVVTTTWSEWRTMHPETTVLTIDTGHDRDYGEGVAYRDYFRHDRLMFEVPEPKGPLAHRIANKAEVVVIPWIADRAATDPSVRPLAVASSYLRKHPVFRVERGGRRFVVVTTRRGAHRVYDAGDVAFERLDGDAVLDAAGHRWSVGERALVPAEGTGAPPARRVASHRSFWFAWFAQYPDTELVR